MPQVFAFTSPPSGKRAGLEVEPGMQELETGTELRGSVMGPEEEGK